MGPERPGGAKWDFLRRAHKLVLLTTLVLLWGLAALSFFMSSASPTPAAARPPARADVPADASAAASREVERAEAQHLDPERELPELQRLLALRAGGLSGTQRARYAAALKTALDKVGGAELAVPMDGAPTPSHRREHRAQELEGWDGAVAPGDMAPGDMAQAPDAIHEAGDRGVAPSSAERRREVVRSRQPTHTEHSAVDSEGDAWDEGEAEEAGEG